MQIRSVGNRVIGADEITWSIHPRAPGHHRYAVNGSYRALRDGSLFYTFSRDFMPGYHRISLRDSKPHNCPRSGLRLRKIKPAMPAKKPTHRINDHAQAFDANAGQYVDGLSGSRCVALLCYICVHPRPSAVRLFSSCPFAFVRVHSRF
jgi:hypothetical protein